MREFLEVCKQAVYAAGAELQRWVGRFEVKEKGRADLVTQADLAAQEVVRRHIEAAFPDHDFLGEEQAEATPPSKSEYRWIVDPLDGTTNYVHALPHYAVSLGLERRGEVLVGAVYNPVTGECFTAAAGQGAWLNGERIHTSQVETLGQSLAVMGFPPGVDQHSPDLKVFLEAVFRCQSVRRTGCASLNLCYLAAGRFDVFWSFSTKIWDIAAGVLIVHEAGGEFAAPDGGPFVLRDAHFLAAANGRLLNELRQMVVDAKAFAAQ